MAEYKDVYEGRFLKSVELADGMLSVGDKVLAYKSFEDELADVKSVAVVCRLSSGFKRYDEKERRIFIYFTFTDEDGTVSPVHCRTIRNRKLGTNSIDLIKRFGQGLVVELI